VAKAERTGFRKTSLKLHQPYFLSSLHKVAQY